MEEQQEEGSQDLRLKFVQSPETQIWKASGGSSQEEIRFSDPNEKRPKVFETHLRKDKGRSKTGKEVSRKVRAKN